MTSLIYSLYLYASEHQMDKFLLDSQEESAQNQDMVDFAPEQLCSSGPATADCAKRLCSGPTVAANLRAEAAFQAGLSIGLTLSRL